VSISQETKKIGNKKMKDEKIKFSFLIETKWEVQNRNDENTATGINKFDNRLLLHINNGRYLMSIIKNFLSVLMDNRKLFQ
jgi:hypothetical protein